MRFVSMRFICSLATVFSVAATGSLCYAQYDAELPNTPASQAPPVIHIHHHHYYAPYGSYNREAGLISDYSPSTSYEYGFQPGMGDFYTPTKINWGNLGFFGAFDPNSQHDGLWVLRVLPRSPADRFGLAPGDFIVKINGAEVESYRQLRDALAKLATKKGISTFTVWDPEKKKNVTLEANFGDDDD